uniref:hypothetical protein n=1 Tax=Prevotella sp. TaxID=59823 RepID=UPI003FF0852D
LREEGVDRNWKAYPKKTGKQVALLAEGEDRNSTYQLTDYNKRVALLAEGVDRNTFRALSAASTYSFVVMSFGSSTAP